MGDSTFLCCAYCWKHEDSWDAILSYKCDICCKRVHYSCIKSPQPSILLGDTFFSFKCQACSENGKESFERTVISWLDVVILVLYNLHKAGQGMCGFYHWKSHICAFIDKHWNSLFGNLRKRTSLWMGTIAGTLSSGCPQFFESGSSTVEQGFWKLATLQPPLPQTERKVQREKRRAMEAPVELKSGQRRCRKAKESALSAAMELKEKRSLMQEGKKKRQRGHKKEDPSTLSSSFVTDDETGRAKPKPSKGKSSATSKSAASSTTGRSSESPALALLDSQDSMSSVSSSSAGLVSSLGEEADAATSASGTDLGGILTSIQMEDDSDLEIDVDIGAVSFVSGDLPDMRPMSPDISTMLNVGTGLVQGEMNSQSPSLPLTLAEVKVELMSDCESEGQSERDIEERSIKEEEASESEYSSDESEEDEEEGEEEEEDSGSLVSGSSSQVTEREKMEEGKKKKGRPRKRRREDDTPPPSPPVRLQRISLFEEDELLQKLNRLAEREALAPHMAQLRRKLICNQTNREYGLPVFDLEKAVNRGTKEETTNTFSALDSQLFSDMSRRSRATKETRDLDRFMVASPQHTDGTIETESSGASSEKVQQEPCVAVKHEVVEVPQKRRKKKRMTGTERARRYRQRRKEDAEHYEVYRKLERQRSKNRRLAMSQEQRLLSNVKAAVRNRKSRAKKKAETASQTGSEAAASGKSARRSKRQTSAKKRKKRERIEVRENVLERERAEVRDKILERECNGDAVHPGCSCHQSRSSGDNSEKILECCVLRVGVKHEAVEAPVKWKKKEPMTSTERAQRYRQRRKEDATRHEAYRQLERQRSKDRRLTMSREQRLLSNVKAVERNRKSRAKRKMETASQTAHKGTASEESAHMNERQQRAEKERERVPRGRTQADQESRTPQKSARLNESQKNAKKQRERERSQAYRDRMTPEKRRRMNEQRMKRYYAMKLTQMSKS